MICFPPAKINLGLRVLGRREDGFHELSSFFIPIGLRDALEIIPGGSSVRVHLSGLDIDGDTEDNLVIRAWRLMQAEYGLPGADIFLHKVIPQGAGLGGGSSDAAMTLWMAREMFSLEVSDARLQEHALRLGSDCPFFIRPEPCLVSGRGERIHPVTGALDPFTIVLLKPLQSIATAEAYGNLRSFSQSPYLPEDLQRPPKDWKALFFNDFESWARTKLPVIGMLIDTLYDSGAFYASMSGSGSSVFGLFTFPPGEFILPEGVFRWEGDWN